MRKLALLTALITSSTIALLAMRGGSVNTITHLAPPISHDMASSCHWNALTYDPTYKCFPGNVLSCIPNPATCPHAGKMKCVNCYWGPCECL